MTSPRHSVKLLSHETGTTGSARPQSKVMTMRTWVIANPKAGSGRALSAAQELIRLLPEAELRETSGPGSATAICRQATIDEVETVVAVGGDGTLQECVTGLCLDDTGTTRQASVRLAFLPAGTGGDYRRSFGLSGSLSEATRRIRSPELTRVSVGLLDYASSDGQRQRAVFANVLSFGLGGLTDRLVERGPKWLGGRASFFLGALSATLLHHPVAVTLTVDGRQLPTAAYSNVAVCLGRYFGGGMQIAPNASPEADTFCVVTMELSKPATLGLMRHIYQGKHCGLQGIEVHYARHIGACSVQGHRCLLDADGEQLGHLDLEARVLPGHVELCL